MPGNFAVPTDRMTAWVPFVGSPTVAFARVGEVCLARGSSWTARHIGARVACVASAAIAPMEAVGYGAVMTAVYAGLVGRVTLRTVNRIAAGTIAAVWGLVYGNAITFSITVWIRRIVINVVLFARDFRIALEHWMERGVAAQDLLWVSTRLWALASKVDAALRPTFNMWRIQHLANQCWQYTAYSVGGLTLGLFNPSRQIADCKERRIGMSMPGLPLTSRLWRCMMRQKWKIMTLAAIASLAADVYVNGQKGPSEYGACWLDRSRVLSNFLYSHTFGLIADMRLLAGGLLEWLVKDLELKNLQLELLKKQLSEFERNGPSLNSPVPPWGL